MIKAIIVDDEVPAINRMSNMLGDTGKVEIKGMFTKAREALEAVKTMDIDVIFLDIEMPEINGITFANHILQNYSDTKIIFVTAYTEYAIDAFDVNAVDYLLKPVTKQRLNKALDKVKIKNLEEEPRKWDIQVKCFGKFTVINKEGVQIKWRTKKAEEFFAYLIDNKGKAISRDRIMDVLWNSFEMEKAMTHLNTTTYNMKKAFQNIGLVDIVKYSAGGYQLDESRIDCDLWRLTDIIDKMGKNSINSISENEKVIDICTGGYLNENYYEWAEEKNNFFQGFYLDMLIQLSKKYENDNQTNKALESLRKGLIKDPLNQRINKELIELYLRMKDEVSATKHYDTYKKKLKKEYGMDFEKEILY